MFCTDTLRKVMKQQLLVYSRIKLTPGKLAKKVLIKDLVKDAQFKLVCLRGGNQNG